MDYTFLLMRHAYSLHNIEKDTWKKQYPDKSYKQKEEYRRSKFNPALIDPFYIDQAQCQNARETCLNLENIDIIICSPLRRCLETCKHLIKGREANIRVIVEPLLSNRLSAAWSIGTDPEQLAVQYPLFDFSPLKNGDSHWMLTTFQKNIKTDQPSTPKEPINVQQTLMKQISSNNQENYIQFFQRTKKLKKKLSQILQNHTKNTSQSSKQVLIISHSCVLSFLLGKELNQKGKVKDKISFEHCIPKKFPGSVILEAGKEKES